MHVSLATLDVDSDSTSLVYITKKHLLLESFSYIDWNSYLRPVSTQENKHGIGPDRNKIKLAYGLSVPVFSSSLNLWSYEEELKYF